VTADETTTLSPEAIVGQLRALRQQIPEFTQMPVADARVLHPAAQVDPEFAHAAINTIGASETVQAAVGRRAQFVLDRRPSREGAGRAGTDVRRRAVHERFYAGMLAARDKQPA
jgi:hypothetical protein